MGELLVASSWKTFLVQTQNLMHAAYNHASAWCTLLGVVECTTRLWCPPCRRCVLDQRCYFPMRSWGIFLVQTQDLMHIACNHASASCTLLGVIECTSRLWCPPCQRCMLDQRCYFPMLCGRREKK